MTNTRARRRFVRDANVSESRFWPVALRLSARCRQVTVRLDRMHIRISSDYLSVGMLLESWIEHDWGSGCALESI